MSLLLKNKTSDYSFIKYLKELLILAFPLFIGSLGHTLIGATDVLILGRYSIEALASVSIANSIIFTIFILGIGIVTAISIILSNKRGAKQKIKVYFKDGKTDIIPQKFWDDYEYNYGLFVVKKKGEWIAVYNMDCVACVVVG